MKRLFVLVAVLALFVAGIIEALSFSNVRPAGVDTPSSGTYNLVCDDTDTLQIDTFFSDTVTLGDYRYLRYRLRLTGYSLADSANDSVVIVVHGIGRNSNSSEMDSVIVIDTIPTTLGTLDSTEYIEATLRMDSLPYDKFFFRTIVQDSFILGDGSDTTEIRLSYQVVQVSALSR